MAELIGGEGEVAIIAHDQTSRTGIDRVKGFTDQIKAKYPKITIVDTQYGAGDQLKSTDLAKAIIGGAPQPEGLLRRERRLDHRRAERRQGNEPGWQGCCDRLRLRPTADGRHPQRRTEAGAITQDPIGIGYKCVEAALKASKGETLPKTIDTGFMWYDKTNIETPGPPPRSPPASNWQDCWFCRVVLFFLACFSLRKRSKSYRRAARGKAAKIL